ncbi:MATE family efflux transporter [Crassaminicella profunda]|uniref:MATE family efflux transporter n=1 Tax=Crassaminicella profunda TaxID=1286698 RepID=UPI001CA73C19|nr:MATE family efflux transporter [Crassaminicella profunda]QZY55180.1 MATE family efflux transporter [Crassaminicella profunda]
MQVIKKTSYLKPLTKEFLEYLLPSISAMWVFSIYTMVDGMFVGKGIGPMALASVNISMPFINMIFAISLIISIGASTLISFHLGGGEEKKSNEIFTLNIIILSFLGLIISILSLIYLEDLAIFLGASQETLLYVKDYLRLIIIFSPFFMLAYSLEVLVKADGFPVFAIVFVGLAAFINILFDYIFVILLDYGVKGAAFATGLSQFISCLGFLFHFIFGKSKLKLTHLKISFSTLKSIFLIGFPDAITELSTGITVYLFNYMILKHIGNRGITAFGVIMYVNNLVIMTMVAINQGMQPLVSFYHGKRDFIRIKKLLSLSFKTILLCSCLFVFVSQFFTDYLVSMFIDPSNLTVYQLSKKSLKIFSYSFMICGINILLSGYFTALKETKKASLISILRGLIVITCFIFILPHFLGSFGIWISSLLNEVFTLCISLWTFFRFHNHLQKHL